ncbi:MAG: phosphatidylglycerophosphatase A [Candidatus Aegiribacteria sp.]|nr:phosphatidylglycerophosphatase A [Candidatus Aegiribacteria sp.]
MKILTRYTGTVIATVFGAGYFPVAPGTAGSLISVIVFLLIPAGNSLHLLILAVILPVGYWSGSIGQKLWGNDPSRVVIDEFAGCWIACLAVPCSWGIIGIAVAFILFRVFDILKPWPVSVFDRMKSPAGILLDDVAAGVLSAIIIFIGSQLYGII